MKMVSRAEQSRAEQSRAEQGKGSKLVKCIQEQRVCKDICSWSATLTASLCNVQHTASDGPGLAACWAPVHVCFPPCWTPVHCVLLQCMPFICEWQARYIGCYYSVLYACASHPGAIQCCALFACTSPKFLLLLLLLLLLLAGCGGL
jgi:hypothetical protein